MQFVLLDILFLCSFPFKDCRRDMTENLLKATLNLNKQQQPLRLMK